MSFSSSSPLLSRLRLWDVRLDERPHPDVLPSAFDVVRVGAGVGKPAVDALNAGEAGPVMVCTRHQLLFIPVPPGTADWWRAAHSQCRPGRQWLCMDPEDPQWSPVRCGPRLWLVPGRDCGATTVPEALHESLSRTRARLRTPTVRPHPVALAELGVGA